MRLPFSGTGRQVGVAALAITAALLAIGSFRPRRALLVIWTDARGGGPLTVHLDGVLHGTLRERLSGGQPACGAGPGVLVARLRAGAYVLEATDGNGRRWRASVALPASTCTRVRLGAQDGGSPPAAGLSGAGWAERPMEDTGAGR